MLRLAHVIIAHQHLSQLIRLVDKVASWGPVCIHVDKKCDETYFSELKRRFDSYQGIRILRTHRVHWGHFSQVDATLSALSELFLTNEQFDYVKLISGQDYPIKGSAEILRFLEDNKGRSFIENFPLPNEGWEKNGGMDRLDYWYFRLGAKTLTFPPKTLMERKHTGRLLARFLHKRRFPAGYAPYGGSAYWLLTRECAKAVLEFLNTEQQVLRFFKHTNCADELFFQTVVLNSAYRESVINNDLTYTKWLENSASPETLTVADADGIISSGCLFARKFDSSRDSAILDLIDDGALESIGIVGP